jgi:hypothetical protein
MPPFHFVKQDLALRKLVEPVVVIDVQVRKDNPADPLRRAIKSRELGPYFVLFFYVKLE